jgi:two-component system NarL family response regulator
MQPKPRLSEDLDPLCDRTDVGRFPGSDRRIRILLVDDHEAVRQGYGSLLNGELDMEIVGEAVDGVEAVEKARRLLPDVILMDLSMPRMDGIEATHAIHAEMPRIRIICLSMCTRAESAARMLAAGAIAYVTKSGRPEILLAAIRGRPGSN